MSEYGAGVWGGIKDSPMDLVQLKAMWNILGVHKFTTNLAGTGNMGWCPPSNYASYGTGIDLYV